jgi:hypothetical protein
MCVVDASEFLRSVAVGTGVTLHFGFCENGLIASPQ